MFFCVKQEELIIMLKGSCYNNEAIYQMQMQGYE